MSFFSWSSPASASGTSTVSNKFWVYWVVTIPLTLFVIILWRVWWVWQERKYITELAVATGKSEDGGEVLVEDSRMAQYPERLPYLTRVGTGGENRMENSVPPSYPLPDFTMP